MKYFESLYFKCSRNTIAAVREREMRIVNTPGRNATAVVEFTIGAILSQTHNIVRGHDGLRNGIWRGELYRADITGDELCDMTVGVIGYSEIGRLVVKYLRVFGCKILIADPYVEVLPEDANYGVEKVDLDDLLMRSDVVTLHARLTPETSGFINGAALDTLATGPPPADSPLLTLENVTPTPHIAGASLRTVRVTAGKVAEEVRRYVSNEPPVNPC